MNFIARPISHAAIVLFLDGAPWLVDVGLSSPLPPLPLAGPPRSLWSFADVAGGWREQLLPGDIVGALSETFAMAEAPLARALQAVGARSP